MIDGPSSTRTPLTADLVRSDTEVRAVFLVLQSVADVAELLEVRETQLTHTVWRTPEKSRYQTWTIRKRRGGVREIHAPSKTHKILQRKLAHVLSLVARVRSGTHGFVPERGIVSNASKHVRRRWVLNIDLKDFFTSINFGRVRGMFLGKPYGIGEKAATVLAQLCCHEKKLPQGAPTSPVVSNMVCARLDGELQRLANSVGCSYTRYADDITFSTNKKIFPHELGVSLGEHTKVAVGGALRQVIEANGFQINLDKVRLQSRFTRQEVTGLVVNRRLNVRRTFVSQIRAMLHAWEKYGYDLAQQEFCEKYDTKHRPKGASPRVFERVIRGKLAFLRQVRVAGDRRYSELRRWFGRLMGETVVEIAGGYDMDYDVFICHASEDKVSVVRPLAKALVDAGIRVWIDEAEITWGESITGEINAGLARSRFVILVLSCEFLKKNWPTKELNAVLSREIASGVTCALSLMVGDAEELKEIMRRYPLLADKRHLEWAPSDVGAIVSALKGKLASAGSP